MLHHVALVAVAFNVRQNTQHHVRHLASLFRTQMTSYVETKGPM